MWLASPSHATALQTAVLFRGDEARQVAPKRSTPDTIRVGILDRVSSDGRLWGLRSGGRALTHAKAIAEQLTATRLQIDLKDGGSSGPRHWQWSPKLEVDVISFSQHKTSFEEQAR